MALQQLVSGDKFRYQLEGYDLDLTYILPNLIAMGVPGEGISSQWRNNIHDVSRFLNSKYSSKYRIWNLTGEPYNYSLFSYQVLDFGFPDHHPPPLILLWDCVLSIHQWLTKAEDNVAVVHCLAGRSRTGCVITSYLLFCHKFSAAAPAIQFFNETRSKDGQNIVLPSQVRYVNYFEKVIRNRIDLRMKPPQVRLKSITISPVLIIEGSLKSSKASVCPFIEVFDMANSLTKDKKCFGTTPKGKEYWKSDHIITLKNIDIVMEGDVEIIFYHFSRNAADYAKTLSRLKYNILSTANQVSEYPNVVLFRYIFHTSFLDPSCLTFSVDPPNLDAPHAGPVITSEWIPPTLRVTFEFEYVNTPPIPERATPQRSLSHSLPPARPHTSTPSPSPHPPVRRSSYSSALLPASGELPRTSSSGYKAPLLPSRDSQRAALARASSNSALMQTPSPILYVPSVTYPINLQAPTPNYMGPMYFQPQYIPPPNVPYVSPIPQQAPGLEFQAFGQMTVPPMNYGPPTDYPSRSYDFLPVSQTGYQAGHMEFPEFT